MVISNCEHLSLSLFQTHTYTHTHYILGTYLSHITRKTCNSNAKKKNLQQRFYEQTLFFVLAWSVAICFLSKCFFLCCDSTSQPFMFAEHFHILFPKDHVIIFNVFLQYFLEISWNWNIILFERNPHVPRKTRVKKHCYKVTTRCFKRVIPPSN